MPQDVMAWLTEYVNSTKFTNKLEHDIDELEKPSDRVRVRLELLSYLAPKVKTVDPVAADANQPINVIFQLDNGPTNGTES